MANFDNVILYYQHPHVATFVQNNTTYEEDVLDVPVPVTNAQAGVFAKGKDNTWQLFKDTGAFIEEHGVPNYGLYGQPGYNITEMLGTGHGQCYVMRVMPEDATYSNVVVSARYKVVTTGTAPNATKKFHVSFKAETITNCRSTSDLQLAVDAKVTAGADPNAEDDDYFTVPFITAHMQGRGTYGDKYKIAFVDATNYDDPDNIYKTLRLDVLETTTTLVRKESIYGTLDVDAFDPQNGESLYIEDLVNDSESGSGKIGLMFDPGVLNRIMNLYNTEMAGQEGFVPVEAKNFDIIFGKDMTGKDNPLIELDTVEGGINITAIDGIAMGSGSEGKFAVGAEGRDKAITDALVAAYTGVTDKRILSKYGTPCDFILDANYPAEVKTAMGALAHKRLYDTMVYLDTGLIDNVNDLVAWGIENVNMQSENLVKEAHCYKIRDLKYTGKTIPMTITHFLAKYLTTHIKTVGLNIPFARSAALVSGMVKSSFLPVIDPSEHDVKKEIFNNRINCYETIRHNVFQRTTAITSVKTLSDLMDEFNMYILNLAVKECETIMNNHIYNFGEPADRARYQEHAERRLSFTLGKLVRSAKVEYKMSARDEQQNILRIALRIVFKTVVKRGIVEVYIDPRSSVK